MSYIILVIVIAVFLVAGIVMAFVPFLPAIPYMLLVVGAFVVFDRFAHLSGFELAILATLTALSIIIDKVAGILGARFGGASGKSLLWGMVGLCVGTIVLPPMGGLIGMASAIIVSELMLGKGHLFALRAGFGSLAGSFAGMVSAVILSVLFLILFFVFIVF